MSPPFCGFHRYNCVSRHIATKGSREWCCGSTGPLRSPDGDTISPLGTGRSRITISSRQPHSRHRSLVIDRSPGSPIAVRSSFDCNGWRRRGVGTPHALDWVRVHNGKNHLRLYRQFDLVCAQDWPVRQTARPDQLSPFSLVRSYPSCQINADSNIHSLNRQPRLTFYATLFSSTHSLPSLASCQGQWRGTGPWGATVFPRIQSSRSHL